MWEDVSYCWAVVCKNNLYHIPRNLIYRHKIPLGHTDEVTARPPTRQRTIQGAVRYLRQGIRLSTLRSGKNR